MHQTKLLSAILSGLLIILSTAAPLLANDDVIDVNHIPTGDIKGAIPDVRDLFYLYVSAGARRLRSAGFTHLIAFIFGGRS